MDSHTQLTQQLAHTSPHFGTGLRRQQSENGSWLEIQLDRGRLCTELSRHYAKASEGDLAAGKALGIGPRQVRTYKKLWMHRYAIKRMFTVLPAETCPTSMEDALKALDRIGSVV